MLREFLNNPALTARDLHDRCAGLAASSGDVRLVLRELVPAPSPRLPATGRWLVENGTDRGAVLVGLGLLTGSARRQDVTLVKAIGLLPFADQLAVQVLAGVPGAARDLMWLAERSRGPARTEAVRLLAADLDPVVRDWGLPAPRELLPGDLARQIAETRQISLMLADPGAGDALWDGAGNLLLAMTSTNNYHYEITRYGQAPDAYEHWAAGAASRPATLERSAASDEPAKARRAAWVIRETAARDEPGQDFAIRVVVPDPETRIMIGGIPVIAAASGKGPAQDPGYLVHSGRLRATGTPHEVMLAEAYCTEGCCGGLYVTIVRDGPEVVWKDWRPGMKGDPPPEARFDAAAYDREAGRAERDYSWEWPARTAARLMNDQLRADPGILGRWDCELLWCTAWLKDFGTARITFGYPGHGTSGKDPRVQSGLMIDIQDQDPRTVAAQVTESMRDTDPRTRAEIIGGSRDSAENPASPTRSRPDSRPTRTGPCHRPPPHMTDQQAAAASWPRDAAFATGGRHPASRHPRGVHPKG